MNTLKLRAATLLLVFLVGCTSSWVAQAIAITDALLPAVTNIVALVAALQGQTVNPQDVALIQNVAQQAGADLQLVGQLLNQYNASPAAAQPGIVQKIVAALNDAQTNLGGIMTAVHITDAATQAKVAAVIGVVLSEVQAIAALLPTLQSGHMSVIPGAKPMSVKQFKSAFNTAMHRQTGNSVVDNAASKIPSLK